ncbi:MAG: CaiB/BaiF CoA-transferase family protein [Desulfotomaculaceae bacterium]
MLKGLRVVDFSRFLPGPYASQRLADLGAEVIKIESPGSGDPTRTRGGGLVYSAVNRNKKSITLNLKEPEGQQLAFRLTHKADVVIESFRPGIAKAMGIGFEAVKRENPGVIYCSLTGFGQSGPLSKLGSHDLNYLALSGVLAQLKDETGRPVQPSFQFADMIGGIAASEAVLAALVQRSLTNQGCYLDIAMTDTLIGMMSVHAVIQSVTGTGQGIAELTGDIIAYRIYETADGKYVSLSALEQKFWKNFCRAVGRDEWIADIFSPADPANNTFNELTALFKSRTFTEWAKFSLAVDCCLAPVLETDDLIHSSYVKDKGLAVDIRTEACGLWRQMATSAGGFNPKKPGPGNALPPALGQHNQEVLTGLLGATAAQIGDWQLRGII